MRTDNRGALLYDEGTMIDLGGDEDEDENGQPVREQCTKIVGIVVAPALFKRGNSDGERFDYESCIKRAEVKCRALAGAKNHR